MAGKLAILLLIIAFFLAVAAPLSNSEPWGFRATITRHTKTATNFTHAALKSRERLSMLAARLDADSGGRVSAQTPLQLDAGGGAYDMTFAIGTPEQELSALADTGSDLIWVKCGACKHCTPQGSLSYYPNRSSSFSKLPCSSRLCGALGSRCSSGGGAECNYTYSYGLAADPHHYTKGYLGSETFTLGGKAVRGIGFGCTTMSEGEYGTGSGLVGLGRGPLSLVSQLNAGAFSYCLTSEPSKVSPLLFGSLAKLWGAGVQSTPFLPATTYYSVNLRSISIGAATTPGPGSADYGVVFDSGTTLTFLAEPAYTLAKTAVLNQTKLRRAANTAGYEACFLTSGKGGGSGAIPKMVLHFDGGADMDLPVANYFGEVSKGVVCWIVQKSPSLSIIGNIMQMNYHVRYDIVKSVLSFQPADCDSL